jgi:hypothetical protein
VLSLKHRNSFKPSCFDCFIYSKYCTGIFSPESSGSFYIRSFSHIYIASFAPASSVVQSRQLMRPLSAALASREVLQTFSFGEKLLEIGSNSHLSSLLIIQMDITDGLGFDFRFVIVGNNVNSPVRTSAIVLLQHFATSSFLTSWPSNYNELTQPLIACNYPL